MEGYISFLISIVVFFIIFILKFFFNLKKKGGGESFESSILSFFDLDKDEDEKAILEKKDNEMMNTKQFFEEKTVKSMEYEPMTSPMSKEAERKKSKYNMSNVENYAYEDADFDGDLTSDSNSINGNIESIINDFDLRKAVLYSIILENKYINK